MPPANPLKRYAVVTLRKAAKRNKAPIWEAASGLLSGPASVGVEVNLSRISRLAKPGAAYLVPGKVLGTGTIEKKVTVGAFSFSAAAKSKIEASGGSALTIEEFLKKYPQGNGVRIVG
jgi:large subunit ribosomal protein L18e